MLYNSGFLWFPVGQLCELLGSTRSVSRDWTVCSWSIQTLPPHRVCCTHDGLAEGHTQEAWHTDKCLWMMIAGPAIWEADNHTAESDTTWLEYRGRFILFSELLKMTKEP